MKITNIVAKRESLTLLNENNNQDEIWTYLSLYNQNEELIVRSQPHHPEGRINLLYERLQFVSFFGDEIFINLDSLKEFIKNK